jgi:hypothetical protein
MRQLRAVNYICHVLLLITVVLASGTALASSAVSQPTGTHTVYVDSVAGDDKNEGTTPDHAWKSLEKVNATTFAPGDHILFKSGSIFTGQLWPKGSGTEAQPIVVDRFGGEAKPVINGAGLTENTLLLKNQQYWEVNNLEITNTGAAPAVRRGVLVLAENYGDMHHIYLRSLTVHDVNGVDDPKHNGGIIFQSIGHSKPSRFVDLRIENNNIYHVDRSGIFGWSDQWIRSKWYPSLGVVIRSNRLDNIGGDGIVPVATDGALVEYNVVSRANQRSQGYNVAIWPWSADNTLIQYNEAYLTKGERDGEGFDADWNSRNTIIQYNYSHDNDGGFVLICNEGGHGPDSVGNTGTIVRYNVSVNDHTRGITLAGPVSGAQIYNNTIYAGKSEKVDVVLNADWNGWADGTYIANNIFYVEGQAQFGYGASRASNGRYTTVPGLGQSTNTIFDANVYFGNLKPATTDVHALTSDPRLASPGATGQGRHVSRNYVPRPGSPAIDSGTGIANNGGRDFLGTVVPSCKGVDRGALEQANCGEKNPGGAPSGGSQ